MNHGPRPTSRGLLCVLKIGTSSCYPSLKCRAEDAVLIELRMENYAVIDNLAVEFARGLNLLTGETGAGKSILIDALSLLLGDKASSEMIRHGAEKSVVSGVFEATSP